MENNAEQRSLQALLRFAADAGSHGSDSAQQAQAANSEDRAWLKEALQDYASHQVDSVQYMKQRLAKIYRFLKPSQKTDEEIDVEDVHESLEEISDSCDQYDLAGDLHKIGGFDIMIQCMQHKDEGICWRACDVLATAAQNHEYCQNALLEMKAMPIMLKLVDNTSASNKVREKAFYALSCLVRGNESALDHLEKNDGFSTLIRAMQSDVARLRMKTIFFVNSLCEADVKYTKILHERGIEQQIVGMLRNHNLEDNPESLSIVENLLRCLYILVTTCEESKKECCDPSYGVPSIVHELKERFGSREEYQECVAFCDKILQACLQDDDNADER